MKTSSLHHAVPVLLHILAWTLFGFGLFLFQPLSWNVVLPNEFWIKQVLVFSMLVGVFYLNSQVLTPRLLLENRTGWFVAVVVGILLTILALNQLIDSWLNLRELMAQAFQGRGGGGRYKRSGGRFFDTFQMVLIVMILGISTSITAIRKWQHDAEVRQALEQQKISTELSFLRAQINPHFFFNTLNNIYALTLIDADTAREALHRLSRMMRYVLYDTQASTTLLSKELAFVMDYIQLMQLRLTDKVTVTFEQPNPLRDEPVAPMLLLPFVENAFKHGVSATQPSRIYVGVRQLNGHLEMEVRNTIFPEKTPSLEKSNGIGLVNTRRRLDLLYPGGYELLVNEQTPEQEYVVRLKLELAKVEPAQLQPA